ncbi:sensor histidine kinase [Blastococcus sp. HT6-30]|uniref:sensor histidine kinase n=1 Tax=Blastococcus sp. HT6-30 TaxID=3144843 RepID=UPI00321C3A11
MPGRPPERMRRALPWLVDGVLTAALAVLHAGRLLAAAPSDVGERPIDALAWLLAAVATLPVLVRRWAPWTVLVLASMAMVVFVALGYPPSLSGYAVLVALYGVAAQCPRRLSVPGLLLAALPMLVVYLQWRAEYTWGSALQDGLLAAAAWSLGDAARTRRLQAVALAERAREAEANREAHSREAVAQERLRIARELHDVMAHSMSVIAVQAGVGRHVMDRDPETARKALGVIEDSSRRTLTEMRQLLGVLRVDDGPGSGSGGAASAPASAGRGPQPGLDRLDELLAGARATGLVVALTVNGTARSLPPQLDLAAYRILQEALTNAAKHAGPAEIRVVLTWRPDRLEVDISDDGRGPVGGRESRGTPGGYGLIGLQERATSVGGELEAGPDPRGGFRVRARLPLAPEGATAGSGS